MTKINLAPHHIVNRDTVQQKIQAVEYKQRELKHMQHKLERLQQKEAELDEYLDDLIEQIQEIEEPRNRPYLVRQEMDLSYIIMELLMQIKIGEVVHFQQLEWPKDRQAGVRITMKAPHYPFTYDIVVFPGRK